MSGRKIVAAICMLSALLGFYFGAQGFYKMKRRHLSRPEKLHALWNADLALLEQSQVFPKDFFDIAEIEYKATPGPLGDFIKSYPPNIKTKPEGRYTLQIFLDELPNEKGVMVRYDTVEKKSGNTTWELNRTIPTKISDNVSQEP